MTTASHPSPPILFFHPVSLFSLSIYFSPSFRPSIPSFLPHPLENPLLPIFHIQEEEEEEEEEVGFQPPYISTSSSTILQEGGGSLPLLLPPLHSYICSTRSFQFEEENSLLAHSKPPTSCRSSGSPSSTLWLRFPLQPPPSVLFPFLSVRVSPSNPPQLAGGFCVCRGLVDVALSLARSTPPYLHFY